MISFEKAQEILHELAIAQRKSLPVWDVGLEQSYSQVSAANIYAQEHHPAFDNSSMDGFALRAQDIAKASQYHPQKLYVAGESSAGKPWKQSLQPHQACRIMTGARVPEGANAVIKVEDVLEDKDSITLKQAILPGTNIRKKGEDLSPGDLLVPKGSQISPEDVMLLASQGKSKVSTLRPLKVAIISTGQEILTPGTQSPDPKMGEIHNSSGPFLKSKITDYPCELVSQFSCSDEPEQLFLAFSKALASGSDIIISTGGVSAGKYDLIPGMITDLHGSILFHKVSMRPGKPILVAKFTKEKPCTFFGLPGNPISTLVGFNFFVEPFIRHLTHRLAAQPIKALLYQDISVPKSLTTFLRANVTVTPEAQIKAELCGGQGSHMLSSLRGYNAWLKIDKGQETVKKGAFVDAFLLGQNSRFLY